MSRSRKPIPQNFNPPKTCGGKYCYTNRLDAEQVIEEKKITDPELELTFYHCPGTNHWHLTRRKSTPI